MQEDYSAMSSWISVPHANKLSWEEFGVMHTASFLQHKINKMKGTQSGSIKTKHVCLFSDSRLFASVPVILCTLGSLQPSTLAFLFMMKQRGSLSVPSTRYTAWAAPRLSCQDLHNGWIIYLFSTQRLSWYALLGAGIRWSWYSIHQCTGPECYFLLVSQIHHKQYWWIIQC